MFARAWKYLAIMVDQAGVRLRIGAVFCAVTAVGLAGGFGLPSASAAGTNTLYAYAESTVTPGLTNCVQTTTAAAECSLSEALTEAGNDTGDTIELAGPGTGSTATDYVGNWTVDASGTRADAPLTIKSAPGLSETLDGTTSPADPCETTSCASSILSTSGTAYLTVQGVTLTGGTATYGAAINIEGGSQVTVTGSVFSDNTASNDGGAIAVGVNGGTGSLTVTGTSSFSGNAATDGGGAIADGLNTGSHGTVTVAAGTAFTNNTATGDGGAIDSGDYGGNATLDVTGTTFTHNIGHFDAGAIGNGGDLGTGTATITDSLFNLNAAGVSGGAIDNGDGASGYGAGSATLTVTDSTFTSNAADGTGTTQASGDAGDGGAINNAEDSGVGTVTVTGTTFASNTATVHGATIDNSDDGGSGGTVNAAGDLFAGGCDLAGGTWHDGGYNVGTDASCDNGAVTDIASANASLLGALAANGGMTDTEYLSAGNPGISVIPSGYVGDGVQLCPRTDQRGVGSSGNCSAGSVDSLAVTGPASTSATQGSAYSGTVSAAGGSGAYSYSVASGSALPAGLSLNQASGVISGTPTQSGTIATTVNVSDTSTQQGGVARLSFTIAAGPVTPVSTATPSSTSGTPKITAKLISAHARAKSGWYRSPVKITFTCTADGATLTAPCPASVLLTKSGEDQAVTRTIKTTSGLTATVTVHISIDETLPIITIRGIRPGATYRKLPKVTCTATDKLSHVASCTVKGTAGKPTGKLGTRIVTYRATATTRAGISVTKIARVRFRR